MNSQTAPRTRYRVQLDTNDFAELGIYKGSWGWLTDHPLSKYRKTMPNHIEHADFALYPDEIFGVPNTRNYIPIDYKLPDFKLEHFTNPLNN